MEYPVHLIFDLIVLVVIILVAIRYMSRGFVAGLLYFIGNLAGLIASVKLSQYGADVIFDKVLRPGYTSRVQQTIADSGTVDLEAIAQKYSGFLPASFRDKLVENARAMIEAGAEDAAQVLVDEVLQPLATAMISLVLFFICLALCRLVISLLVSLLKHLNKLPVVGSANRFLGLILGVLAGMLDVYILLVIVYAVMMITGDSLPYLNTTALTGSYAFKVFGFLNPFF